MPGSGRDVDSQAVDMDSRAARETARQRRRAELRKQERHARPPSKQQVEYDRELDSWIASHGAPDTELDRPAWKALFDKARKKQRDRLRHQKRRLAQQPRSSLAQQPRSSLETMVDDVWHQVLSRLGERDLVAVACTCTALRNHEAVAREQAKVWAVYQAINMFIGALAASDGEERYRALSSTLAPAPNPAPTCSTLAPHGVRRRRRVATEARAEAARVARASHPRGTIVHGAPIARGVPPLAAADYEVRVVVETPANHRDDFKVGLVRDNPNPP